MCLKFADNFTSESSRINEHAIEHMEGLVTLPVMCCSSVMFIKNKRKTVYCVYLIYKSGVATLDHVVHILDLAQVL